jgi:hypothetical protein
LTQFSSRIAIILLVYLSSDWPFLHVCDAFATSSASCYRVTTNCPSFLSRPANLRLIGRDYTFVQQRFLSLSSSSDSNSSPNNKENSLPTFLDPGTKGGVIVLGLLLFFAPFLVYNILTSTGTLNEEDAGRFIGVGFTIFTSLLWVSTYIFRVATKDMTYVRFHSLWSQKVVV